MRLLHVDSFEFEQFEAKPPPYAILSHRWTKSEAILADIERWRNDPSDLYPKVYGFARYVRDHLPDVKYIWIDSCCIHQDSASELSEGVNRMFSWYRDARICFAYLPDVEHPSDRVALRNSVWFKRGWTLQELVASTTVVFLTNDWQVIGHKGAVEHFGEGLESGPNLDPLLSEVTGIPQAVLQDFSNSSGLNFHEKMLWMEGRQTLKEEDMVYALFGIFGVTPGANYGEGKRNAELRLKEAMRQRDSHVGCTTSDGDAHSATQPAPAPTILPRGDPNFIGRHDVIDQLHTLSAKHQAWIALVGLGGVGKTQIAIRYVQDLRERDADIWILWIFASKAARFDESIRDIAGQIKLTGWQDSKVNILQLMQSWLAESKRRWVVIFDNADDADFLLEPPNTVDDPAAATKRRIDYFPTCNHGSYVITSRNKNEALKFVTEDDVIDVLPMDTAGARLLLQKRLGPLYNEENGARLARALDYMPLALSQAASFIKQKKRYTIERYLTELEKSRDARTSLLRQHGTVPMRDRDASSSIILTWQISFEWIHKSRKSAADLLALMSCCDRQAIPQFLLYDVGKSDGDNEADASGYEHDETEFYDDIDMLENFSFISATVDTTTWEMHRLVQDATQWWLRDQQTMREVQRRFVDRLHAVVPINDYENWSTCQILAPHVRTARELLIDEREVSLRWATIMCRTAEYEASAGSLITANDFAQASLHVMTEMLGHDDLDRSWSEMVLGGVHQRRGLWKDAEELQAKVMETRRRVLGPEHLSTLTSMNNLALTYSYQGRYKEAEELQAKVFERRKEVLGLEHLATLTSINNLASTYSSQGRWKEAEELQVAELETTKRVRGEKHPHTLTSMNNLASIFYNQGRWKEAEELQAKLVETQKRVLGPEHLETLSSTNNLALTYLDQGRYKEAEELHVQVFKTMERVLGDEHPYTLTSMNGLALTYSDLGRYKEAEELQAKLVETKKRVLGTEQPGTLTSINNLALTYSDQGRYKEAEELQAKLVETRERVLGLEHPQTLLSTNNLASTYSNQGRRKEAEELHVQVFKIMERVLGDEHPYTLTSMNELALTYSDQGRWKDAEELLVKLMDTRERMLGSEHRLTLTCRNNLALTYFNQGRYKEAEELQAKLVETRERVLGEMHPDTLMSLHNLMATYYYQSRMQEALPLARECSRSRIAVLGVTHPDTLTSIEWLESMESEMNATIDDGIQAAMASLTIDEE